MTASRQGNQERRRGPRVAMQVPLELEWEGGAYHATTSLINGGGALVLSPIFCPLRSELRVRNLQTGFEADFRVVWSWFDESQEGLKCRLALEMKGPSASFWGPGYQSAAAQLEGKGPVSSHRVAAAAMPDPSPSVA